MATHTTLVRMLGGSALGLLVGTSVGCLFQEDEFVTEYAAEVCRLVRECGRELRLPGESEPLPSTSACEDRIEAHYASCTAGCDYIPRKARRCLRRLRDNECNNPSGTVDDETIPIVCNDVFRECQDDEQAQMCRAPSGCSIGDPRGSGSVLALGLLVLGLGARRRRGSGRAGS